MSVIPPSSFNTPTLSHIPHSAELTLQIVNDKLEQATTIDDRLKKRDLYDSAFRELSELAKSNQGKLHAGFTNKLCTILNTYAQIVFYGQVEEGNREWGFKKSAQLAELTLAVELDALCGRDKIGKSWTEFSTIEDFFNFKHVRVTEDLENVSTALQDALNPALTKTGANEALRFPVYKTLERLAYSYQNLSPYKETSEDNYNFHSKLDEIVATVLSTDLRAAYEYEYNRGCFLVELQDPENVEEMIRRMDQVETKFKTLDPAGSYDHEHNWARVLNKKAAILFESDRDRAKDYLLHAYAVRAPLTPPADKKLNWDHYFLLNNIRSGLVRIGLEDSKLDKETFESQILPLAKDMEKFITTSLAEKVNHSYFPSQLERIGKVKDKAAEFGISWD